MVNVPSLKMFLSRGFQEEEAKKIRTVLLRYRERFPFGDRVPVNTLGKVSEIMQGEGMETIEEGTNQNSPCIHYVNLGDAYTTTVLFVKGHFRIGDWGSIVERGSYS